MDGERFWGVASGVTSRSGGLFWTRYGAAPSASFIAPKQALSLVLELSRSADFASIERSIGAATRPEADGTVKVSVEGLSEATTWYYRFRRGAQLSATGRFRTAPAADSLGSLNLGFGGCANGRYAPFPLVHWRGATDPDLDLFVMLGDAAYGNSIRYPAPIGSIGGNPNPIASSGNLDALRQAIWTKMLLNLVRVESGQPGISQVVPGSLASLYASQAMLALADNKDLGDNFLEAGGAPLALLEGVKNGSLPVTADAEGTSLPEFFSAVRYYQAQGKVPEHVNQSPEYQALIQSFLDYLPVTDGTLTSGPSAKALQPLYNVTEWGRNARIITLDDRSYRDVKILDGNDGNADDDTRISKTGADSRDRTILGAEQLAWFKQQLLKAKADGILWTIVNISSPIDAEGAPGSDGDVAFGETAVDAKSFWGNYRWERNEILKFIAANNVRNVVFLSSDDHEFRVNELDYAPDPDPASDGAEGLSKGLKSVPGVFTVVASPLGAARPDGFLGKLPGSSEGLVANFDSRTTYVNRKGKEKTFENGFLGQAAALAASQIREGLNPIGLSADYAGLRALQRGVGLFDDQPTYQADINNPQIQDFWSPQTFNWGQLQIDAKGLLTVSAWGIKAYPYENASGVDLQRQSEPAERMLSFQLAPSLRWDAPVERVGASGLRFNNDQSLSWWRADQEGGLVDFDFGAAAGAASGTQLWCLMGAAGGQQGSLSPGSALNPDPVAGWLATERRAVGSRAALSGAGLGGTTWTPIARRQGQSLLLESVSVEGTRVTARFQDGITGIISLPGSGTAAAPADTHPLVSVQRLGMDANGLAFYEADPVTGAVGSLLPGDADYLKAALAQAERSGHLLEPTRLPAYGAAAAIDDLKLDPGRSYGLLLLVRGDRDRLLSSFAAANPGGAPQMLSLGSEGRGMVIGIEDQSMALGPSDSDFNDLIVRIDAGIVRLI